MNPVDDELRLSTVEAKVATLELKLVQITTGMYLARWIVGVCLVIVGIMASGRA